MTGYPLILNGDHAEFEAERANTKPEDRPDWPLTSFDAQDWAKAFCKTARRLVIEGSDPNELLADEAWMISWFASALMRGFDEHSARIQRQTIIETCLNDKCPRGGKQVPVLHVED